MIDFNYEPTDKERDYFETIALIVLVIFLTTIAYFCYPGQAATNATPQQFELNAQTNYGLSYLGNATTFSYAEPNTSTALFSLSQTFLIPANSTENTINLATAFPVVNSALVYTISDMSNPGLQTSIGTATGANKFIMNPNGFMMIRAKGSAPILYIDNPSINMSAFLQVTVLAN